MNTYVCRNCLVEKTLDLYPSLMGRRHGSRCFACLAASRRAERAARPPRPPRFHDRDRTVKTCNRCTVEKPVAEFYWNQTAWSGDCRECRRIRKRGPNGRPRLPKQERPPKPAKPARPTVEERFWSKVDRRGPEECWPWKAQTTKGGYGLFWYGPKAEIKGTTAHRFAMTLTIGPIESGLDVDHQCHDKTCKLGNECPHRRCCNPSHLAVATRTENMQNSNAGRPGVPRQRRTHCPYGHPYDEENTAVERNGNRKCRECRRFRQSGLPERQRAYGPKPRKAGHPYRPTIR